MNYLTRNTGRWVCAAVVLLAASLGGAMVSAEEVRSTVTYDNRLTRIGSPRPILADYPQFVAPVEEDFRYEAPTLVDDDGADLSVRAWRFSYNARGIIEIPNRLRARDTAVIVVHPWGIDDAWGWQTPEPAGVAFACTPERNKLCHDHARQVVNPLLERLRGRVGLVAYSLPGNEDPARAKLYRSIRRQPSAAEQAAGAQEIAAKMRAFRYEGAPVDTTLQLDASRLVASYFAAFPGLDASAKFDGEGFWQLPIPVMKAINVAPEDVVIYDAEGYAPLRDFLKSQGIRHVLLAGYHADMCVCRTTAGYENLSRDFNLFLVGDAVLATFPGNATPRHATNQTVSFASLTQLITQASWIEN